jgi:hypothetical protein
MSPKSSVPQAAKSVSQALMSDNCKDAEAGAFEEILRARGFDFSVRIVPVPAIPRGVSGKVSRAELKVLLLSHS